MGGILRLIEIGGVLDIMRVSLYYHLQKKSYGEIVGYIP